MATNTDIKEYPSYDTKGEVVKAATIGGKEGKQIKITEVSLFAKSSKAKVNATITVSINGTDYAVWIVNTTDYGDVRVYNKYPFEVDTGKDAKIAWTLTTADKKYPAKIRQASYTFEYVDVETPVVETPVVDDPAKEEDVTENKGPLVVIECESTAKAEAAVVDIKNKGILTDDMKIYIAKSV